MFREVSLRFFGLVTVCFLVYGLCYKLYWSYKKGYRYLSPSYDGFLIRLPYPISSFLGDYYSRLFAFTRLRSTYSCRFNLGYRTYEFEYDLPRWPHLYLKLSIFLNHSTRQSGRVAGVGHASRDASAQSSFWLFFLSPPHTSYSVDIPIQARAPETEAS